MSFEAVLWATSDAPIADVNEFAVLVMLAEKADPDGCNTFPSRPTMATRTRVDSRTVLRCLQRLEERRLIAKGDQRAAEYIRADRRPVVYDLLIPYSWFPNIERINKERQERGRAPLTPADRPDIAPPPEKVRRNDLGKKRSSSRGVSKAPRKTGGQNGHGVSLSPPRGVSQSATGCLTDTRTSPLNLSEESLSPRGRARVGDPAAVAPAVEEREKLASPKDKNNRQPAAPLPGQRAGEVDKLERVPASVPGAFQEFQAPAPADASRPPQQPAPASDAAARVVDAYTAALGRPVLNGTRTRLHHQAAEALTAGYPETWVTDRARELAANASKGWTDLAVHIEKSTVPLPGASPASPAARRGLPDWCEQCGTDYGTAARNNPRFRLAADGAPCQTCHPAVVASA